ncbi:Clavaminate synthase-like protein [Pleurotus eryngii]|uniref:Clavaminate synthase-like protein n=1 Tax=Pleurotus eryngii TaxID=5323 RepID=A0A9P5ZNY1_PLEER|nr:Clavaminate synthase-like protein [Pleurotus eryngii]
MERTFESLSWFSEEYFDLNGSYYETLRAPPSALEFSRFIHISRPVVIEGFELPALHQWSDDYLIRKMGNRTFSVAVTPNGRADAVTKGPDGLLYFVEPYARDMSMEAFLSTIHNSKRGGEGNIHYLQSQNGNLFTNKYFEGSLEDLSEFEPLRADVLAGVPWCTEALRRPPDAVNVWIGDSMSVTSIHNDPYENIYTVVRGAKHFTLLPPTDSCYLKERSYPHATYTRPDPSSQELVLTPSLLAPTVRWSSIQDPGAPGALDKRAHPINITLTAGQTLYLPPGWWHHVRQSEELTIAINWWYDIESRGMSWVMLRFLRPPEVPLGNGSEDERSEA